MHFQMRVALEHPQGNVRASLAVGQALFGAAIGPARPDRANHPQERVIRRTGAQRPTKTRAVLRIKAEQQDTVSRESRAITGPAEWLRRRRDDSKRRAAREPEARGWGRRPGLIEV